MIESLHFEAGIMHTHSSVLRQKWSPQQRRSVQFTWVLKMPLQIRWNYWEEFAHAGLFRLISKRISWSLAPRPSSSSVCVNLSGAPVRSLGKQIQERSSVFLSHSISCFSYLKISQTELRYEQRWAFRDSIPVPLRLVVGACSATSMSRKYENHFSNCLLYYINNIIRLWNVDDGWVILEVPTVWCGSRLPSRPAEFRIQKRSKKHTKSWQSRSRWLQYSSLSIMSIQFLSLLQPWKILDGK